MIRKSYYALPSARSRSCRHLCVSSRAERTCFAQVPRAELYIFISFLISLIDARLYQGTEITSRYRECCETGACRKMSDIESRQRRKSRAFKIGSTESRKHLIPGVPKVESIQSQECRKRLVLRIEVNSLELPLIVFQS